MLKLMYVFLVGVLCGALIGIGTLPYVLTTNEQKHSIFVYGTLENNFIRYYACLCLVPELPVILSDYKKEGLNIIPAPGETVSGSIIAVSHAQLERIDNYEDVPRNYTRAEITIEGTRHWVYIKTQ